jgi:hypothetical protein
LLNYNKILEIFKKKQYSLNEESQLNKKYEIEAIYYPDRTISGSIQLEIMRNINFFLNLKYNHFQPVFYL